MTRLSRLLAAGSAFALGAGAAAAQPAVVVDIAPVHSVVARVMDGVGTPDLLLAAGSTPHEYALRPSEARALEAADVVFWVGPDLTPWLGGALESIATSARHVPLIAAPGLALLPVREGGPFEAHDHDHGDHAHDHDHGDHAHDHGDDAHAHDHAHDEDHAHEHDEDDDHEEGEDHAHGEGHAHGEDHAHGGDHAHGEDHDHAEGDDQAGAGAASAGHAHRTGAQDAHVWLDPANAAALAAHVAEVLAEEDPERADDYRRNADAFAAEMTDLAEEIAADLAEVADRPFIVFHDAYQYFENRFGLAAAGSIALHDADQPSPARMAEIQARIREAGVACAFAEPQFEPRLIDTAIEGSPARRGTLDPLGAGLEPGPGLYPALLRALAADLRACLAEG